MKRHGLFALGLILCFACLANRAAADGLIRDGIGAISTGRGGTNIAHSDNGAVLLDNPAGLANMSVSGMFEIGADAVFTDLDYTDPQNLDINGEFWPCGAPHVTYVRKSADGRWAYGIGAYAPAGFAAKYDDVVHPFLGPSRYKSIGLLGKILPGVAVKLTDELSVGATLGVAMSHVELEGPFHLQNTIPGLPTQFDLQSTGAAITGSIGLQYKISDQTMLGMTYSEQSDFSLNGSVAATVVGPPPLPLSSRFDAELEIAWPRSLGVGIKHDINACHRVSCDVIWYDWSAAFDEFTLTLTNPTDPTVAAIFGPTVTERIPMRWKDTVSVRLGYEWMANCRDVWRLGYVYHDSPCPDATLTPYTDGVLEHAFSLGLSRRYSRCLLNLAYQYSFSPERTVGTSALAGGDFSNSTFQAQAHWASASILIPF